MVERGKGGLSDRAGGVAVNSVVTISKGSCSQSIDSRPINATQGPGFDNALKIKRASVPHMAAATPSYCDQFVLS